MGNSTRASDNPVFGARTTFTRTTRIHSRYSPIVIYETVRRLEYVWRDETIIVGRLRSMETNRNVRPNGRNADVRKHFRDVRIRVPCRSDGFIGVPVARDISERLSRFGRIYVTARLLGIRPLTFGPHARSCRQICIRIIGTINRASPKKRKKTRLGDRRRLRGQFPFAVCATKRVYDTVPYSGRHTTDKYDK